MRRAITAAAICVVAITVMPVTGARAAAMTIDVTSTTYDGSATVTTATADCTGPSSTKCTLEDALALANANPGSTINVEAGDFVVDGELQITEPVTINGHGASALGTAISQTPGDDDSDLVVSSPGAVSISGVELAGGDNVTCCTNVPNMGGGILIKPSAIGGTVTLDNDLITLNTASGPPDDIGGYNSGIASEGGGIAVDSPALPSNLTLSGTIVSGNTAQGEPGVSAVSYEGNGGNGGAGEGGGIYFDSLGTLSVGNHSSVEGNFATAGEGGTAPAGYTVGNGGEASGAGIDVVHANSALITDSTLQGNVATGGTGANGGASVVQYFGQGGAANGGAVAAAAPLTINGTSIESNQAVDGSPGTVGNQNDDDTDISQGGGVDVADGATITQSLIAENVASAPLFSLGAEGGGVEIDAGASTIVNTTVYGNEATSSAFGVDGGGLAISAATTLASDTIDANTTIGYPLAAGSNVATGSGIATKFTDTIVADPNPMGPTGSKNCLDFGTGDFSDLTSPGGNLEDDSAGSCGFSHAHGDIVGSSPDLASAVLALNGAAAGTPESLLPPPGSPELRAGGACIDPTQAPAVPLTVDQRGLPRPSGGPCDIGAVQIQAPASTAAPAITPQSPSVGQQLTCGTGVWTGDGKLAYTYAWLRGATQVGTGSTYTIQSADAGRSLTCAVTATSTYGDTGTATSAAVSVQAGAANGSTGTDSTAVTGPVPVTLGRVSQTHPKWRERGKAKKGRPPVGTAFRFTLSGAASVRLSFSTTRRGVKFNGKCVARSRAHKGAKCRLTQAAGALTVTAKAGANSVPFMGKIDGKSLAAGRWMVVISVAEPSGTPPATSTLSFTIDRAVRKKPT